MPKSSLTPECISKLRKEDETKLSFGKKLKNQMWFSER